MSQPKLAKGQFGVSLIELMIATTLGLFLLGGVGYVYLGSKNSYSAQSAVSRVQESLRFGFEFLSFDLRMAGYSGCVNLREMTPQVVANPPVPSFGLGGSVIGYEIDSSGNGWSGNPDTTNIVPLKGTHVITLSRMSLTGFSLTDNSNGSQFFIANCSGVTSCGLLEDQVLIVSDCRRADVFRGTSIGAGTGAGAGKINIAHASNKNTQPAGSTCAAGSGKLPTECGVAGNYKSDAQLATMESWSYYVALNANGVPALFRVSGFSTTPEELVEGIYDLRFQYGLDTIDDTIYVADTYDTAANVAAGSKWNQVVSVKMTLRARSTDDRVMPVDNAAYAFNGANVTDRRYLQQSTSVIGLRNLVQ